MMCCCGPCSERAQRPTPSAVRFEDPAVASTSPSGSPSTRQAPNASGKPTVAEEPFFEVEPKVLLRNLKVQVPVGKLTVVVGATGSGKSTLLQALLGQLEVSRGHVWATRSIAYVPQQSWIMNATLRDNVLFFADLDEARLAEALRVSQMETDLELLNNGLETEIGEKGVNLSGGQKARVNLARAVYADREMYLLDDPLSALDAHVGESVIEDCILGKLRNKTRVLATHQLHVVPKADYVIALDNCKIVFTGDSESFQKTAVYHLMATAEKEENDRSVKSVETEDSLDVPEDKLDEVRDEKTVALKPAEEEANRLITREEKPTGSVPLATYLMYFDFCGGRKVALLVLVVYLLTEVVKLSSSIWLSLWATSRLDLSVRTYLVVYILCVTIGTACTPLRYSVAYTAMRTACKTVHSTLLRSVARGTMEFFDRTPQGRIMNRFAADVDAIDNTLQMSIMTGLDFFFSITSALLVSIISQPFILLPLIPCVYFYYRMTVFYNAANREMRRHNSITKSPVFSLLSEVTVGMATITAYGRRSTVMKEALRRIDAVFACGHVQNVANHWIGIRVEFLSCVLVAFIALFGVVVRLTSFGLTDVGLISLSLTMTLQTTGQLNFLVRQVASVEADMNSVERIQYYSTQIQKEEMPELDDEVEDTACRGGLTDAPRRAHADNVTIVPLSAVEAPTAIVAGSLEFRGVQMRYREGLPLVLSDVSFRIEPREKVGVVGRTGSGKSTLLLTFMRMVDVCGGAIDVNGRAIRSYPLRELRRQFSMIPQDPVLFDGTVRLNVDPFLQASAAEVWAALEIVGLKGRVSAEPEGIDGRVLEGGSNFSVGQRQLLCMARALLKRGSGFILMDEATANIDQTLDRQIQGTVMRAFADYTVITIAHRLLTVAQYDKIIVMDHGVVAEMGSPRELVSREDSVFKGMVESTGKRAKAQFMALLGA
ncbi:ABC transporter [Strigomonas culicis]|uniref:ABC transporter n=1 Tax=Strigomonas culicis TaxID=28005 RepID=S9V992_9TRYP|nr:ABC transporter [Strigomonas culicis]|eukprot:EPY19525.1 ABC transporter [Strigomonas culicis]